jgi:hypothetical protein
MRTHAAIPCLAALAALGCGGSSVSSPIEGGGASGAGGEHSVGSCASLSAPGVWDSINPPGISDTNCQGSIDGVDLAPTCEAESTDGGATWRIFRSPPGSTGAGQNWEETAGVWLLNATSWIYGGNPSGLWLTTDSGQTFENVTPPNTWAFSGGEEETHPIVTGPDGTYYLTTQQGGIVRSSDGGHTWSVIPNINAVLVALVAGRGHLYACDQWSDTFKTASFDDPTVWTTLPGPPIPSGCPFLDYDAAHGVLYASCFTGGLWRMVTP